MSLIENKATSPEVAQYPFSPPQSGDAGGRGSGSGFGELLLSDVTEEPIEWLVQDVLPKGLVTAFVGDEGVGKGLFCSAMTAKLTRGRSPIKVAWIASEDDPRSMLIPRLRAADADLERVVLLTKDTTGNVHLPVFPTDVEEFRKFIRRYDIGAVIIDPLLSVVSSKLQIKDTQHARQFLDPLSTLAREEGVAILLVGHTNRGDSPSPRNRYGASVAIRQTCRIGLMALADQEDEDSFFVGIDKTNITAMAPAVRYRRVSDHKGLYLVEHEVQPGHTVKDLLSEEKTETREDRRFNDLRRQIEQMALTTDFISRQDVIELYGQVGMGESAADKALRRWSSGATAFLAPHGGGMYAHLRPMAPTAPPALLNGEKVF
jgi:RecA-family ATPase